MRCCPPETTAAAVGVSQARYVPSHVWCSGRRHLLLHALHYLWLLPVLLLVLLSALTLLQFLLPVLLHALLPVLLLVLLVWRLI